MRATIYFNDEEYKTQDMITLRSSLYAITPKDNVMIAIWGERSTIAIYCIEGKIENVGRKMFEVHRYKNNDIRTEAEQKILDFDGLMYYILTKEWDR